MKIIVTETQLSINLRESKFVNNYSEDKKEWEITEVSQFGETHEKAMQYYEQKVRMNVEHVMGLLYVKYKHTYKVEFLTFSGELQTEKYIELTNF
jgi:hypothetical protein